MSLVKSTLPLTLWVTPVACTSLPLPGWMLNIPMNRWFTPSITSYFGGSVKTVLVDNQKAAVLKNHNGNLVFKADFMMLAEHYGFAPRA